MNNLIKSILAPIGVPVGYITYTGTESEYIVFNFWSVPGLHADDHEVQTNFTIQIDVFSQKNFIRLANEVKNRMINAGFMRILEDSEYIQDTKTFRKIYRFSYTKEVKDDEV